jgi:thymidylate kinase
LINQEPERWVVVDASQPKEIVQKNLRQVILERLKIKKSASHTKN